MAAAANRLAIVYGRVTDPYTVTAGARPHLRLIVVGVLVVGREWWRASRRSRRFSAWFSAGIAIASRTRS